MKDTMEVKGGREVKRCPNPGRKEYLVGGSTIEQTWGGEKLLFQHEERG